MHVCDFFFHNILNLNTGENEFQEDMNASEGAELDSSYVCFFLTNINFISWG